MGSAKTRFSIATESAWLLQVDGLVIPVFKTPSASAGPSGKGKKGQSVAASSLVWPVALSKSVQAEVDALAADEKFDGSRGKLLTLRSSAQNQLKARRVVVVGLGEADALQPKHWEAQVLKAISSLTGLNAFSSVAVVLPENAPKLTLEAASALAVDAVTQATYQSMEAKDSGCDLQKAVLLVSHKKAELSAQLAQAQALAQARVLVKDLVNHPSNLKNTNTLVEQAKLIAKQSGVKLAVQNSTAWIEKNMPCFYTVAKGSVASDPPKFITLRYQPKAGKSKKHIAVVGKSVIFDTGGYQVKPGDYMVTMKGDMTGGAVALATMRAIASLELKHLEVSVYLAATPNKIDSDAMIPDSIVNTTCGKKVEIRHTDAEGRLTLIDAVAQAAENKPDEIITIATLTGSASQAVGYYIALMGNNEALRTRVAQAGQSQAEPIQTLDVNDDDYENIKSKLDGADIINTSQRKHRGAQSAAAFVMSGAPEGLPMAHLDIAGADMTPDEKATGVSVKTIIQYLLNEDAALAGKSGGPSNAPATARALSTTPARKTTNAAKPKAKVAAPAKAAGQKSTAKKASPAAAGRKTVAAVGKAAAKTDKKAMKTTKLAPKKSAKPVKPASKKR